MVCLDKFDDNKPFITVPVLIVNVIVGALILFALMPTFAVAFGLSSGVVNVVLWVIPIVALTGLALLIIRALNNNNNRMI